MGALKSVELGVVLWRLAVNSRDHVHTSEGVSIKHEVVQHGASVGFSHGCPHDIKVVNAYNAARSMLVASWLRLLHTLLSDAR